jgi:tryptophan-rich sensory protein
MVIKWEVLIATILICNLLGAMGAMWTSSDSSWYKNLKKPKFNPPSWVFGPVWTILFTLMGIALYFVWVAPSSKIKLIALVLFGIQFLFNIAWSYLFFGINKPLFSFIDILFLLVAILATGFYFFKVEKIAGYLLVPYFLWVGFASFLNYSLWRLNG